MSELSLRDLAWMVLLGGGAAAYLGRYVYRAVQRGRCAGCGPTSLATPIAPGTSKNATPQKLNFRLAAKGNGGGEGARRNGSKSGGPRALHRTIGLLGLPLILLLLVSGFALLFAQDLRLADRPLPVRLALSLYGPTSEPVVATAERGARIAVAVEDGVITRLGSGPWRGVRWTAGGFRVRDVAWLPGGQLACATDGGVWISADTTSWDYRADSAAGVPGAVSRLVVVEGRVWAQTVLGPRVSEDGGISWQGADQAPPARLAAAAPEAEMGPPPVGSTAALLEARGWPTWERLVIDLHAGNLFDGRWRYVVLLSWCLLVGLAVSGPVVAQRRRQHLKERDAARAARAREDGVRPGVSVPSQGSRP
jgi:hypothetical protein